MPSGYRRFGFPEDSGKRGNGTSERRELPASSTEPGMKISG
jgi:hypothetical protein